MARKHFSTDDLLTHPPRIVAPNGANAVLREYTQDDVLGLLTAVQDAQAGRPQDVPARIADALYVFCADETGRAAIDALPITSLLPIISWLQTADSLAYACSPEPDGELEINGKTYAVRVLTVGAMKQMTELQGVIDSNTTDLASAITQSAEALIGMIDGMTLAEWRRLPRRVTAGVERFIAQLLNESAPHPPAAVTAA